MKFILGQTIYHGPDPQSDCATLLLSFTQGKQPG